mmetsp:Transcript_19813/g.59076  ORF Transcript_19813/g.59076 Transcript_19813/m.59076 type:complete len:259 (+) Transcript_19813:83-859(+)
MADLSCAPVGARRRFRATKATAATARRRRRSSAWSAWRPSAAWSRGGRTARTVAEIAIGASAALAIASGRRPFGAAIAIAGTIATSSTRSGGARTYVGSMLGLGVGAGAWRRGARSRATKAASNTHASIADRFLTGGASMYNFRGGDATTGESPSLSDTIADAGVRASKRTSLTSGVSATTASSLSKRFCRSWNLEARRSRRALSSDATEGRRGESRQRWRILRNFSASRLAARASRCTRRVAASISTSSDAGSVLVA